MATSNTGTEREGRTRVAAYVLAGLVLVATAVAVFALSPLLVGSIYLNAYDLWPAFLLAAALALFVREKPMICVFSGSRPLRCGRACRWRCS